MLVVFDFGFGERRAAIDAPVHGLVALVQVAVADDLRECTQLVSAVAGKDIHAILGSPDDMKFKSSMTLFANVTPDNKDFVTALQKYYDGEFDEATLARLEHP